MSKQRLIVMCVDALFTTDLADVCRMEGFREILEDAAIYENIECIYPTLTYPCHATIMTGCWPDRHGISHNEKLSPAENNREWYWGYGNLKEKTIFDYARERGLTTAALEWPVTAGGPIDYLLPEIWSYDPEDTQMREAILGGASEGAREIYEKNRHMLCWKENPRFDAFNVRCAVDMIHKYKPEVIFMHQSNLDHVRHVHGLHAPQVQEALRLHGHWIQEIADALKEEGLFEDTAFVILGDHGHLQVDYNICPNVLLKQEGLLETDEQGTVRSWDAYVQSAGISAQLFVKHEKDLGTVEDILKRLAEMGFVREIFTREQVKELYHLDGEFAFVAEAAANYAFGNAACGELIVGTDRSDYKFSVATHGHLPFRGEKPCFIVRAKDVPKGVYEGGRLVDEGPTMMKLLGLQEMAGEMEGRALY